MKVISAAVLAFVVTSLPAYADGMLEPYTPSVSLKPYNWTGAYAGLHAGGAFSADTSAALSGDPNFIQPCIDGTQPPSGCNNVQLIPSSLDPDPSDFIGGVQAGYNWRIGAAVIGLEIDVSYSALDDSDSATRIFDPGPPSTIQTPLLRHRSTRKSIGSAPSGVALASCHLSTSCCLPRAVWRSARRSKL